MRSTYEHVVDIVHEDVGLLTLYWCALLSPRLVVTIHDIVLYVILIEFGGYASAYHTHFPIEETNDDQASIRRDIVDKASTTKS